MPTSNRVVDLPSVNSRTFAPGRSSTGVASIIRHELVDAQVEVLRMYLEKQSTERLIESLDRLIACTRASFREEEALMQAFTATPDIAHRNLHDAVLAQLELLRGHALEFDRGRLLAQLILVDRQLNSHISEAAQITLRQPREQLAECEAIASIVAEGQAHH